MGGTMRNEYNSPDEDWKGLFGYKGTEHLFSPAK
jgi:hypothetical protein